ncbi:MAG: acylneuraminate cytidylyltransferase family protein [Bacteroidales bacterium]|nr:acylneuraminate cytidylyltransferase family protein [Bacteroidales bacterium]
MKKILFVIPARGGSKGIPGKNIKPMGGIPLICRSIDIARKFVDDKDICVTTDSDEIINVVRQHGMEVPFKRPDYLATDTASSYDVLIHAVDFYKGNGIDYDWMVLLQPTTPFRKEEDIQKMIDMMSDDLDMVVSVKQAETNPYYNCYAVNEQGYLQKFIKTPGAGYGRQAVRPVIYEKNGSVYVIKIDSLRKQKINEFEKVKYYEMDKVYSIDLDEPLDWIFAEAVLNNHLVE